MYTNRHLQTLFVCAEPNNAARNPAQTHKIEDLRPPPYLNTTIKRGNEEKVRQNSHLGEDAPPRHGPESLAQRHSAHGDSEEEAPTRSGRTDDPNGSEPRKRAVGKQDLGVVGGGAIEEGAGCEGVGGSGLGHGQAVEASRAYRKSEGEEDDMSENALDFLSFLNC